MNFDFKNWTSQPRIVCGVMTGTSLDGIDFALVRFRLEDGKPQQEIISYFTDSYPEEIKSKILAIIEKPITIQQVSELNFELSKYYSKTIIDLCKVSEIEISQLDAIGIHGQTVWHEPPIKDSSSSKIPNTLQLGSGSVVANLTGITTVSDFRSADVALGGQGAPLVPIYDYEFLKSETQNRIALNIGGIANITVLPANATEDEVIAFDTGPGNVWIDKAVSLLYFGKDFDVGGKIASKGRIYRPLFERLNEIEFCHLPPPKSTGRELFSHEKITRILKNPILSDFRHEDLVATISYFTAFSIAENIKKFAPENSEIIVSGGGSYNKFLLNALEIELPNNKIELSRKFGMPPDVKEAMCFAYLTWRTLAGLYGNLPSVTGAKRKAILGSVSIP